MAYWTPALLAAVLLAEPPAEEAVKKELARLEGTWVIEKMTFDGTDISPDQLRTANSRLVLKGNTFKLMAGDKVIDEGTYQPDPGAKPRAWDIVSTAGPNKGKTIKAIYELDGETLRACYGGANQPRPTEFSSKPKSGQALAVYKRAKGS
jgi:uncharacterized protein (TIGR03067 family)